MMGVLHAGVSSGGGGGPPNEFPFQQWTCQLWPGRSAEKRSLGLQFIVASQVYNLRLYSLVKFKDEVQAALVG